MLPEAPVSNFAKWVHWKAERCDTPSWWTELSTVPGEDDARKLARQVRASFRIALAARGTGVQKEALFRLPLPAPCLCSAKIYASRPIQSLPART